MVVGGEGSGQGGEGGGGNGRRVGGEGSDGTTVLGEKDERWGVKPGTMQSSMRNEGKQN